MDEVGRFVVMTFKMSLTSPFSAWRTSSLVLISRFQFRPNDLTVITGYPGCEYQIREALTETIGQEKADLFFDKVSIERFHRVVS